MARKKRTFTPVRAVPKAEVQPVLTVPEMGAILGLSRASAYGAAHRGEVPVVRAGKRLMIPTAELRKLLGLPTT
ncbi:Helix-turn-helix domain-containing protein [Sinosporangium album]|uniref:Helix-turn-helix domain-containing protein n=1 Tax=Sinosporangium album TaxID=504805 RepID=A0A1G8KA92_9ACTN|nr:helix-turn-helix domain-containing protein [Sinosporangium album]SDI40365.1 Helix-turn-helix domain-containing protein [Sinosporangium album]